MKKIMSLFVRNYDGDRLVRDEVVPGAEWVVAGEGVATEKHDGTACMIRDGKLFKRYDRKKGRTAPPGFEPCEPEPNAKTGHWPGWVPVGDGPEDKWHREARTAPGFDGDYGTYELVGPKIQGNPYELVHHFLYPHGSVICYVAPCFNDLRAYFRTHHMEGLVWHHPDGRMVKIKARDFGISWP